MQRGGDQGVDGLAAARLNRAEVVVGHGRIHGHSGDHVVTSGVAGAGLGQAVA